ncbi:MAG: hypothetical protein Q7T73_14880, partial [Beijerinckiaceae bacterium]|nr:hypothetical protein [Beijerinckiaceae bacterium]
SFEGGLHMRSRSEILDSVYSGDRILTLAELSELYPLVDGLAHIARSSGRALEAVQARAAHITVKVDVEVEPHLPRAFVIVGWHINWPDEVAA